ncbi:hypothetical protein [Arcanobacterium hippocoleae]|uniref:hypothetical protein n=1 Tax=Arcanobacterium hippocoleae TaxID=149017 RepID=UPI003340514E
MTLFLAAIAVALCAFAIFTVIPGIFGVFELLLSLPLAQLISFRSILTVFFLGIGICYLLPAFLSRNKLRRIIASIAAICLLTSGAAHGMTVISRGLYFYDNLAQIEGDAKSETPHLNVLTYNTKGGATTTSDIVKIMLHDAIDVAVLPETSTQQGEEIQQALAAAGVNFQRFDTQTSQWEPDFSSTVILVSGKLGEYRQLDLSAISGKKQPISRQVI